MLCDRPVNPRFKDLRKPKWERLDFDRNLELIVTVDKLLRPEYFAKPEMRVPTLRGNVEQDNYKYQLMIIDIDNDGKAEPVLRFVESCWPGNPRSGGAALLVLQQGKNDGQQQTFVTPGLVVGRLPLTNRVGLTIGAGVQFAVSRFRTSNHNAILSVRLPF